MESKAVAMGYTNLRTVHGAVCGVRECWGHGRVHFGIEGTFTRYGTIQFSTLARAQVWLDIWDGVTLPSLDAPTVLDIQIRLANWDTLPNR